jgi:hypothetical protein
MNTPTPLNPQESKDLGQSIVELISDLRDLTGTLDSFALSFTLAWERRISDSQPQHSPTTDPQERTAP